MNNYKPTGTVAKVYVAPAPAKKELKPNGDTCGSDWDCTSYCCAKNIMVMPREGIEDLYNLRPQFYTADKNEYKPPGGVAYSYTDKSGGYDTTYGCYGGSYYNVAYKMKDAVAYDKAAKTCLGNYFADLNYVNYNSTEWQAEAKLKNLTAPVDYYWTYTPQKSGDTWNYKDKVCQSNATMCSTVGGSGGGAIAGAVIGGCIFLCILFVLYKACCSNKNETQVEEVMVKPAEETEVVVQPGMTIESQTVTHSTTTQQHQAYGPPPGVMMMPPPPMPPGGGMMQPGMQQPGMQGY